MLTILTLVLGFMGGISAVLVAGSIAAKRNCRRAVDAARTSGYNRGYSKGAEDGYEAGRSVGKHQCSLSHASLEQAAAEKAAAEVEARWEMRLPQILVEDRARIAADLLQVQQEAAAKLVESVEDSYW
jgi:flagellar biosynthesis/type III secretory pathway protein FliH